jgi:hypothetical protein
VPETGPDGLDWEPGVPIQDRSRIHDIVHLASHLYADSAPSICPTEGEARERSSACDLVSREAGFVGRLQA